DRLPVPMHHLTRLNPRHRDFVPRRNRIEHRDRYSIHPQLHPRRERHARDGHVIQRVQMNRRIFLGRQLGNFEKFHVFLGVYLIKTSSVACSPACTCSFPATGCTQNPVPSVGTGKFAGPSTTTKLGVSTPSSSLPMWICKWHCVRRTSPLIATPH